MGERFGIVALSVVLVLAGVLAWQIQLRPPLKADPENLATLPMDIGGWQAVDVPLDATVERVLRADFNLQRAYVHPVHGLIWLYLGYYGTARGGRPEHTPRGCYTGAGWAIEATRSIRSSPASGLSAREYVVVRAGDRRLVHYWYRSHRRTGMTTGLEQNLDRIAGRLLDGRADGALIRISTPIPPGSDDLTGPRGRLIAFSALLDPLIGERWPDEWAERS